MEVDKKYQIDFENALATLEDIQLLSDFSLGPLISNAYFYLTELKRKADSSTGKFDEKIHCNLIEKLLKDKMAQISYDFFNNKNKFKSYQYIDEADHLDIRKWNLLLEAVPEFFTIISLFNFHGLVDVNLTDSYFKVSGVVLSNSNLESSRKLIYAITRKLLRNKMILTYQLTQVSAHSPFRLELKLDYSYDRNVVYQLPIDRTRSGGSGELIIGLADNLFRYKISKEKATKIDEHHVLEILPNLKSSFEFKKVDCSDPEMHKKDIVHFPFIFRPFSIILPVRGSLEDCRTGKHDVSNNFEFIDFFSFFEL